jgi:fatty-acyl-CoA synthase
LGTIFRVLGAALRDTPALIEGDRVHTYGELNERANRLANFFAEHGVTPGGRVAMVMHNCAAFIETQAACAKLKAAAVPLSYRLTSSELEYIFGDSSPAAVVFHADLADAVLGGAPRRFARVLLAVGREVPGCLDYEKALASANPREPKPRKEVEASELVMYTSGTTGRPKGAVRALKGSSVTHLLSFLRAIPLRHGDVHLVAGPMYHALGGGFSMLNLGLGATQVLLPKFTGEEFLAAVERRRVTTTAVVPTMLRELCDLPSAVRRKYDIGSLRAVVAGGAALEFPLVKAFADAYGPHLLYNLYGATEFGWVTVAGPEELLARPNTIGRPFPGCEVALLDEQRREVPQGQVGELFVKSDLLIDRYHRNAEATSSARFRDYFTVGDLATRDPEGFLFIAGRKVDMVISGGVNIYPAEIEQALLSHPAIGEAAVVGVPDERWGEALRAYVSPRDGRSLDPEEIQTFLRERLAGYKIPRQYRILSALPRNPTGKVLKRELRAMS